MRILLPDYNFILIGNMLTSDVKKDVSNTGGFTSFTGEELVQALTIICSERFQTETGLLV